MERRRSSIHRAGEIIALGDDIVQRGSWFLRIEQMWEEAIRGGTGLRKCLAVLLPVIFMCACLAPHFFMTGTISFQGAREECRDKCIARLLELGQHLDGSDITNLEEAGV
jgi:hypothetical protein